MASPAEVAPGQPRGLCPERSLPPLPIDAVVHGSPRTKQQHQKTIMADMQTIITNGFSALPPTHSSPLAPLPRSKRSSPRVTVSRMAERIAEEAPGRAEGGGAGPPKIELTGAEDMLGDISVDHNLTNRSSKGTMVEEGTLSKAVQEGVGDSLDGLDKSPVANIEHTPTAWGVSGVDSLAPKLS